LIATGAHVAKKLPIPNADHPDNWMSLNVLRRACLGENIDLSGKRIIVLGGGNVALDTARTVIRLGASEVRMACLETRGEMPGFEWEIVVAEEEGIEMCPGRTFKEIVLEDNQIVGVRCVEVNFRGFVDGRPDMDEIPDTEHILPADIVIWAIGQGADLSFLPEDGSVKTRELAGIQTDSEMMTSMPGVFVAGDVHRGVTFFVVDAIGEGHTAARGIDRYLRGDLGSPETVMLEAVEYDKKEIENKLSQASQNERVTISAIPLEDRVHNFKEVDLAITEEQAIAEAQRCLICGPCSECQACVEACKAGAIAHDQQETSAHLNLDVIIFAENATDDFALGGVLRKASLSGAAGDGDESSRDVHYVEPNDPLSASAAAADVLAGLGVRIKLAPIPVASVPTDAPARIGAFVCECGDHISNIVNTEKVRKQLSALPNVAHTQVLPFSCSREAAESIQSAVDTHHLDKVVLSACSCCSVDQACYSCTYQRLRSRQNLGVLPGFDRHFPGLDSVDFEFINIREQCAWVHADEPEKATAKAIALTTAAVARVRGEAAKLEFRKPVERSVLILGTGKAAATCRQLLKKQGIPVEHGEAIPTQVLRTNGGYMALHGDESWGGQALILTPSDADEAKGLLEAFGREELHPRVQPEWGGLATHRPGVFFCDPGLGADLVGKAVAARVAAWLGRVSSQIPDAAKVDPARCRACGTCVEICEFGAPELTGEIPIRAARIDPVVCTGCGTCAAHCPSDAISYPNGEGTELETTISVVLALGD
jgi:thioredoxin reductase/ferredoxin